MANHVSIRRDLYRGLIKRFPRCQRSDASAMWVEFLMRANWKATEVPTERGVVNLVRGQLVMGRDELGEQLGINPNSIRGIIKRLERISEITKISTDAGTIITIVRYDEYVDALDKSHQQNHQQTTSRPPADHHLEAPKASIASEGSEEKDVPPTTSVAVRCLSDVPGIPEVAAVGGNGNANNQNPSAEAHLGGVPPVGDKESESGTNDAEVSLPLGRRGCAALPPVELPGAALPPKPPPREPASPEDYLRFLRAMEVATARKLNGSGEKFRTNLIPELGIELVETLIMENEVYIRSLSGNPFSYVGKILTNAIKARANGQPVTRADVDALRETLKGEGGNGRSGGSGKRRRSKIEVWDEATKSVKLI